MRLQFLAEELRQPLQKYEAKAHSAIAAAGVGTDPRVSSRESNGSGYMPYSPFYRHRPYRFISLGVSPYTEMARWLMDRRGVEYREESHVPMLYLLPVRNPDPLPGLKVPEGLLANARQIMDYWESRGPYCEKVLGTTDPDGNKLIDRLYWTTGIAVRRWAYFYLLANRHATLRCWQWGAPLWERIFAAVLFPLMRAVMRRALKLTPSAPTEALAEIDDCFACIEKRLRDGRVYLMGANLTAVDIVFASLMGPLILPNAYGGPLPRLEDAPPEMRREIARLRETVAGRLVMRLYDNDRGKAWHEVVPAKKGVRVVLRQIGSAVTGSPRVLRAAFWVLRNLRPVLMLGKTTVVTRNADVVDALDRDREFTIAQINGERMESAHAAFILGWDRSAPYDRESAILRRAVLPTDLAGLGTRVTQLAEAAINAAHCEGRIDVVSGLSRLVPTRVVASYFGVPGPNEQIMMRWMRTLFYQLFFNRSNDSGVVRTATVYANLLRDYLIHLIETRKMDAIESDDILTRLVKMQSEPGDSLDDDGVRRNISGLIVGAVDTTSAAVAQAIDQLLDRPQELAAACAASRADDVNTVAKYVFEALRFNPQTAGLLRYCAASADVGIGSSRSNVSAGSTLLLATLSAMFDPAVFQKPSIFRIDRKMDSYLHFGAGMHTCFGRLINQVQIPHIAMALLKLKGLRRAAGAAGRLVYDGPFPDRLVVEFNA
jgi:cytochrome P450